MGLPFYKPMIGATLPPAEFTKLLLAHYPLTRPLDYFAIPNGSNNRVVGIRSGHGEFVCKTILAPHNLAALHHEQRLLHWLSNQELSFAVPASLPTHSGELILHNEGSYHILTPLLPGQKPDWHAPQQIELVGAALGELHPMLAAYPHATADALPAYGALKQIHPLVPAPDELTPHHLQLPPTPATTGELAWWREEMAAVRAFVEGPYLALPRQLFTATLATATRYIWPTQQMGA
ncbi:MAG: phosphotransferase [Caldilineaceae bacterium]